MIYYYNMKQSPTIRFGITLLSSVVINIKNSKNTYKKEKTIFR